MIDIHAHILPGLDDGAQDLQAAVEMARIATADGISAIIATPHVATGMYENSKDSILHEVGQLNDVLKEEGIPLSVYPGAEYLMEPDLPRRLQAGEVLTLNNSRYMLIELPFSSIPSFTDKTLFEIMVCGVTPILAHPERNYAMQRDPRQLLNLVEKGVLAQVTVGSLVGHFGAKAQGAARLFLRSGCVQFLASDAHSAEQRSPVILESINEIKDKIDEGLLQLLTTDNPASLLNGGPIVKPETVDLDEDKSLGWLEKIRKRIERLTRG